MSDRTVTALLAGDDPIMPAAAPGWPPIEVIGRSRTGHDTVDLVLAEIPDVVLLDTAIGDPDSRAVCRRIREWAPATRVLALTAEDDELAYTTVVAGAAGVVSRECGPEELATAAAETASGESVLLPRTATRLLHDVDAWARRAADPLNPPPTLTATEREVLHRLGEGLTPAEIATTHAVTSHLVNLHAGFAVAKLHRYVLGAERLRAAH